MKFRKRRGPNCEEARVSATTVIEKVTPATVITDPAMVDKRDLAPSGPALYRYLPMELEGKVKLSSMKRRKKAKHMAENDMRPGTNQRLDCIDSQRL